MTKFNPSSSIIINGGKEVQGQVQVPGDKISTVHLIFAPLISEKETHIENMNFCDDVISIIDWAEENNIVKIENLDNLTKVKPISKIFNLTAISNSRASICLVSACALKFGQTEIGVNIGGCCFTNRLIDRHLDLINAFGISLNRIGENYVVKKIKTVNEINFDCSTKFGPSVGVTAHALIAALVFKGEMTLTNIALEPAVGVLIDFLKKSTGRKITLENRKIKIYSINSVTYSDSKILLPCDTTIALTYVATVMATKGYIFLKGMGNLLFSVKTLLKKINVQLEKTEEGLHVCISSIIHPKLIECKPWPGIPSDSGPIIIAGLSRHKGETRLVDKIYDSRSTHVEGLNRMGYCLDVKGQTITVKGQEPSETKVIVEAIDIRAGAVLLIGASARNAETVITEAFQLFRGYPNIIESMTELGINIKIGEKNEKR